MSVDPPSPRASRRPRFFPPPESAGPEGALVMGGDLNAELLLDAYSHGIFPWPHSDEEPLVWWSLDPRAIIELGDFRPHRRVLRRLRSGQFVTSADTDFAGVMRGCAVGPGREGGSWITPNMIRGYTHLHRLGHAHSVEIRSDGQLVGGVYGVSIGGLFAAESMFHRHRDASTAALAVLIAHLKARGYGLLDIQQWTEHTGRLGAIKIPRREYLARLAIEVERPVTFGHRLEGNVESLRE
ncbi:leucyl/phenylalanyl-tRNA--protein transferase [Aeoliella sp.]|uniref:leucyl/phenylalanyl-tRNA--protein transferase n=1 Tax=Aeoliella sp. TaxID=2795800 RepID=UPI003CCC3646